MLENGKKYSLTYIRQELFKVAPKTWRDNKDIYLEYFSQFYRWEWDKKATTKIKVLEELKEWEIPPKKLKQSMESKAKQAIYNKLTVEIVKRKPLNTIVNISNDIEIEYGNPLNHKDSTRQRYVSTATHTKLDVDERVWCRKIGNSYFPIDEEQLTFLRGVFANYDRLIYEKIADEDGEERLDKLDINKFARVQYLNRIDTFKDKYGFRPVRAKKYVLKDLGFETNKSK